MHTRRLKTRHEENQGDMRIEKRRRKIKYIRHKRLKKIRIQTRKHEVEDRI